ncbi:uncharacterized protein [Oscarella lobularis]|uniref:uncharacterized protein isoform X3 n=1 Tax=Oscarella lobularis TaxID=121494 RepID=UPI0033143C25
MNRTRNTLASLASEHRYSEKTRAVEARWLFRLRFILNFLCLISQLECTTKRALATSNRCVIMQEERKFYFKTGIQKDKYVNCQCNRSHTLKFRFADNFNVSTVVSAQANRLKLKKLMLQSELPKLLLNKLKEKPVQNKNEVHRFDLKINNNMVNNGGGHCGHVIQKMNNSSREQAVKAFLNEFCKGREKVFKEARPTLFFYRMRFFDPNDLQFLDVWKAIYDIIEKLFKKGILKKFTFVLCTSANKENIKGTEDLDEVDRTCDSQCDQKETSMNQNSFIPEWEKFTETFSEFFSASADCLAQTEDSTVDLVTISKFEELARATKDFDSTLLIGSGSFGDVFLADLEVGGRLTKVAVKRFKPPKDDKPSRIQLNKKQFPTEISSLIRVNHENIVKLMGLSVNGPQLCLLYEYVHGRTLRKALAKESQSVPSVSSRLRISSQIASALKYLHCLTPGLLHRDVKSGNVLLGEDDNAKLADFGLATITEEGRNPMESFSVTLSVGTKSYMAPETYLGKASQRTDVYAFGVVLYEIVTGLPPYSYSKKVDLVNYMLEVEEKEEDVNIMFDPRVPWPHAEARELTALAKMCTDKNSKRRPLMDKVDNIIKMLVAAKFGYDDNDESPPLRTAAAGAPDHHDSDESDDSDDRDKKRHKPAGGKKGPKNSHQSSTDTLKSNSAEESRILRSSFSSQTETRGIALSSILHNVDQDSLVWPHELLEIPFKQLKAATGGFNSSPVSEKGCLLGSGSFGDVYLGRLQWKDKPTLVAVKKFKPPKHDRPSGLKLHRRQFPSEIQAMSACCHKNVVKLLAYSIDSAELCIVYELLIDGTLKDALSENSSSLPTWEKRLIIALHISEALNFIHSCEFVHRDVKSSNILLGKDKKGRLIAKLADFGFSSHLYKDEALYSTMAVGTQCYMAPEVKEGRVSREGDVYAFGMVMYEIVTGLPPYSSAMKTDLILFMRDVEKAVGDLTSHIDPRKPWPPTFARRLLDLAKTCTSHESSKRPIMKEICKKIEDLVAGAPDHDNGSEDEDKKPSSSAKDELRMRGCENAAETCRGNCVAGAGGDDGSCSDGDDSDSEDKRKSNDKRQRQAEFGPRKGLDYLESPTSSGSSSENHSLETDDVDDIDDLGVKLLGYDDMKQATNDFDEDNKRLLGSGSFGKVYLGDLNLRGKDVAVAVKRYKPPKNDRPSTVRLTKRQFSSEMKALSRCQHPNIISVIAYCIDGPELCMAYELIRGGTLREALSKNNPNPPHWKDRLFIVQDLSDALNYLHSIGIIHRDVKTANILLKNDDVERVTVKLADFGLSTFWDCDKSYVSTTVMVGSRSYMPPEAFLGILSKKVDVYALGMVFYEIVTGLPPYSYSKKMDLITYMKDQEKEGYTEDMIDPRIEWCKNLPGHLLELAKLCSAMDRRQRPSMDEVLAKMRKPKFL